MWGIPEWLSMQTMQALAVGLPINHALHNMCPFIMLCRSNDPLELMRLPFAGDRPLWFVLVNPVFEAPTSKMRAALPPQVGAVHW